MPINVFSCTSRKTENKRDTSSFVHQPNLGTNFIESIIEECID